MTNEQRRVWRAGRTARGLCQSCPGVVIRGSVLCHNCKQRVKRPADVRRAEYLAKKAQGVCVQCAGEVADSVLCRHCSVSRYNRRSHSPERHQRSRVDLRTALYGVEHVDRRQSGVSIGALGWALAEHRLRMEAE